jgi:hypothetical protein
MWQPSHFTTRRAALDFSSSGGGTCDATQLYADEERIANAIELIDFSADPVQLEVCEECGHTHCEPGGWVSFRRCGRHVLVVPAFAAMQENDHEYSAPKYLRRHGVICLVEAMFSIVRSLVKDLPPIDVLAPLTRHEAVLAYQWEAPRKALGKFPTPAALDPAVVLASDPGEPGEQVQRLNALLAEMYVSHDPARPGDQHAAITLYLDFPGYPAWQAFSGGARPTLLFDHGFAIGAL